MSIAPRSQEASQHQLSEQHKLQHAQDSASEQFVKHVKDEAEVVIHAAKSEQMKYRYDSKKKGSGSFAGSKKKSKKKAKDSEEDKGKQKEEKQSSFDIKI